MGDTSVTSECEAELARIIRSFDYWTIILSPMSALTTRQRIERKAKHFTTAKRIWREGGESWVRWTRFTMRRVL
jgi:hypothetical protein